MKKEFLIYINKAKTFRVYDSRTNECSDLDRLPRVDTISSFFVPKQYSADDEGIMAYVADFKQWVTELKINKVLKIFYDTYHNHHSAVEMTFKRLAKGSYENHEEINAIESDWMEKCYNTGMMYCNPGTYDSYGYDFSLFYPSILASKTFMIPTKRGKEVVLKKLADVDKLQVGYYHVLITCENDNFKKLFAFSKHHTYSHLSLKHALIHGKAFNVQIELIQDGKPNAYLYEKRDVVTGESIFGNWYETIVRLRKQFPKNGLIKQLGSSLWGHLAKSNTRNVTYEKIESEKLDIGLDISSRYIVLDHITKSDDNDYYILRDTVKPYAYNIRIKAFLTAAGRNQIASVAMHDIENCVRIHTDGVAFCKEQVFDTKFEKLIAENKTTGLIEWKNVNSYTHLGL